MHLMLLLLLLLFLTATPPASGRRSNKKGVRTHPPPLPAATGPDITSARWLASMERDGTLPVVYTDDVVPSNGALFSEPLALEPCPGGWRCTKRSKTPAAVWDLQTRDGDFAFCDFATVSADELTAEIFHDHFHNKQPLIIRQGADGKAPFMNRAITDLFSRKGLLNSFGPHPASVGTSLEIVHKSGTGSVDMNIGEFVNTFMSDSKRSKNAGEPLYIFQRGVLGTDIVTPSVTGVFDPEATEVNIWMVGPPLSGTTFHFHASAFTGLAVGRKRWFLYPPTMTPPGGGSGPNAVPTFPITYWFTDVYPKLDEPHKPVECMQHAGDLMYVPEGWYHAVINVDDVVAASFQNKSMQEPFQLLFQPDSPLKDRLRATELNSRIDLKYFVGESLRKAEELDAAAEAAKAVADFDPLTATAWCSLAMAEEQLGNLTDAEDHFAKAVSLFPPGRLPSILYSQFLKRHPQLAKDVGLEGWQASEKVVNPSDLIGADCDPFQLLE